MSGAQKLRDLRARMDADLDGFRDRLADLRTLSDEAEHASVAPAANVAMPPTTVAVSPATDSGDAEAEDDYRPTTWLV